MNNNDIIISIEDPRTSDAFNLIEELSGCLQIITGNDGKHSFDVDDFLTDQSLFAVARDLNGVAVGCGGFRRLTDRTAEIKRMYARKTSSGIGSKLLAFLEGQAVMMGYSSIRLETRLINQKAVAFYRRSGYQQIPNYGIYANKPEAICFEKLLST